MNYEEKYKQALERARIGLHDCNLLPCDDMTRKAAITIIYHLFPELAEAESEDERIRKGIIRNLQFLMERSEGFVKEDLQERIAWLEKQGEQKQTWEPDAAQLIVIKDLIEDKSTSKVNKVILRGMLDEFKQFTKHEIEKQSEPQGKTALEAIKEEKVDNQNCVKSADKIEPKFKVGDWIISNNKKSIYQVIEVKRGIYVIRDNVDNHEYHIGIEECEKSGRLWSINDARDGDVLVCKGNIKDSNGIKYERICLFNNLDNAFFTLTKTSNYVEEYDIDVNIDYPDNTIPATKEQKEILFMAMKEAGYEWDAEKKELKKIGPKTLNADKVVEWLNNQACLGWIEDVEVDKFIEKFKKDFEL